MSYFSVALLAYSGPRSLIQFRSHFFTDGRTPWTSDQPVARPLPKHRTTQTQNKCIHTPNIHTLSGIRTMIPVSERAKTVHALDGAATVTDLFYVLCKDINIIEVLLSLSQHGCPWECASFTQKRVPILRSESV
jgi:hypothetical protein